MGAEPNIKQLDDSLIDNLMKAGLDIDEIKIITVYRHLHYGVMSIRKRFNKLAGHVEYKETY